jgi:hypothetical protein
MPGSPGLIESAVALKTRMGIRPKQQETARFQTELSTDGVYAGVAQRSAGLASAQLLAAVIGGQDGVGQSGAHAGLFQLVETGSGGAAGAGDAVA